MSLAFVTGLKGTSLSGEERAFLRDAAPWGLILFRRNVEDPDLLSRLTNDFREAVGWLEKRHGKENVVGWSIHRDESTPHLVAYVVPLDDKGKLNAKQWTGGSVALSKMQTDFAKTVGARHGLERGIEGSKAHHQTIKDFYAQIDKPGQHVTISPETAQPKVLKKGFLTNEYETPEMVAERLTAAVQKAYTPAVEAAKLAASERRRADEMTLTAQTLSREKKEAQERLQALQKHLAPVLELETLAKQEFVQLFMHTQERVKAIVKYSPGMVEPAQQEQARAFISTLAGKEIAAPKVGKQHDGPSLG